MLRVPELQRSGRRERTPPPSNVCERTMRENSFSDLRITASAAFGPACATRVRMPQVVVNGVLRLE